MKEQYLFDVEFADKYPVAPGYKKRATSRAAAETIDAKTLRAKVLTALAVRPMTADECAARMGIDKLSVRPRLSELSKLGRVTDSGLRRRNVSKKKAIVWRLV